MYMRAPIVQLMHPLVMGEALSADFGRLED